MCKYTDKMEQKQWESDISSFQRYKDMLKTFTDPRAIEHVKRNLQRIKDKYPRHLKNETW